MSNKEAVGRLVGLLKGYKKIIEILLKDFNLTHKNSF